MNTVLVALHCIIVFQCLQVIMMVSSRFWESSITGPYLCPGASLSGGPYNYTTTYAFTSGSQNKGGALYQDSDWKSWPIKNLTPGTVIVTEFMLNALSWDDLASCNVYSNGPQYTNNYFTYLGNRRRWRKTCCQICSSWETRQIFYFQMVMYRHIKLELSFQTPIRAI